MSVRRRARLGIQHAGRNAPVIYSILTFHASPYTLYGLNSWEECDGGLLCQVSGKKGNQQSPGYNHEKWQAGYSGSLSHVRDKGIPHRRRQISRYRIKPNSGR